VVPRKRGLHRNDLFTDTYVYPGIVRPCSETELVDRRGRVLQAELDAIRNEVVAAYGLGSGNCHAVKAPRKSLRGRAVEVEPAAAKRIQTPFAVVIGNHICTLHRNAFLPLVALTLDCEPTYSTDVLVEDYCDFTELHGHLPSSVQKTTAADSAIIAAGEPFTLHASQITRRFQLTIPDLILREVEKVLRAHFSV
jgi:hypothetical protein